MNQKLNFKDIHIGDFILAEKDFEELKKDHEYKVSAITNFKEISVVTENYELKKFPVELFYLKPKNGHCRSCNEKIKPKWNYCPICGRKYYGNC